VKKLMVPSIQSSLAHALLRADTQWEDSSKAHPVVRTRLPATPAVFGPLFFCRPAIGRQGPPQLLLTAFSRQASSLRIPATNSSTVAVLDGFRQGPAALEFLGVPPEPGNGVILVQKTPPIPSGTRVSAGYL